MTHEHAPHNAMDDSGEIARFHDRCSELMRELLNALAVAPDRPRPFPEVEDAIGWPRRRIASVLGGVCHLRQTEFGGRRPYRFQEPRQSPSGRWEMWMDRGQAAAVRAVDRAQPRTDRVGANSPPRRRERGSAAPAIWSPARESGRAPGRR